MLFEAQLIAEYATGFSTSIMMFINIVFFFVNKLKMKNIIELIRKFEDFGKMSKAELTYAIDLLFEDSFLIS